MPRIDPFQLLKCLSVLLGPTGGIKSKEEVHRLANLMTKFSKKLVSKCIYIQILKTTNTELLSQFMDAGGWSLVHMWLTDGIVAKNWALIQELLELLHLCPVKIERLKSNNCPKLIKGLSKEVSHQGVRLLASRLVEQWLKIVKGEAAPNSVPAQIIGTNNSQNSNCAMQAEHYTIVEGGNNVGEETSETTTVKVQDLEPTTNNYTIETNPSPSQPMQLHILNPSAVPTTQTQQQQQQQQQQQVQHITKQSYVVVGNGTSVMPSGPVCKITIRDGNHVLVKVETDAANINNAINSCHEMNGEAENEAAMEQQNDGDEEEMTIERLDDESYELTPEEMSHETKASNAPKNSESSSTKNKETKENVSSDSNKSSDKENRDSHKTDDKKSTISSSADKKSSGSSSKSSSSKHGSSSHRSSSSNSHRSSHRSSSNSSSTRGSSSKSSKDKDRHHHSSSSSKHGSSSSSSSTSKSKNDRDKEREKEKEKLKKDQADKDKATLEKVQAQALSSKLGKIPKKKAEDEKQSSTGESGLRKSSTDSKDSSKENKDKTEAKKNIVSGNLTILEKKNISISIENRKNSLDSARPKTVKTFNSKFRSTGLEEEVKPPPPRSAAKKTPGNIVDKKIVPLKPLVTLKRTSPLRETSTPADKRAKLSLDPPAEPTEEKKGAIKLISPKPKPMVLQESDMFMDALMTASTKSKEPRKRNKRRPSISKESGSDSKKSDHTNSDGHESPSQNPSSPQAAEDRSPIAVKPNFKFYQDTLETDEDKDDKEELVKKIKEEDAEEMKLDADGNEDYETSVSNLVKTEMAALAVKAEAKESEEDSEESKTLASPEREEASGEGSNFVKKDRSLSPQPEIRYVDGLRSVLLLQKRKGPKKHLKWKTDLESIRYFELDETERVNVTKTFTDMKQMEKQNEREAFQMARKLSSEDVMEEKTTWKPLIPIDLQAPLVEPGKDSREKEIQYAREKGILQALYFNRSMIPDSPAEPDEERHHIMTDPKIIPLEDLTGNKDSEKDFTGVPWPEPKPSLPPPAPVMQAPGYHFPPGYPHNQPPMMPPMGPPGPMGPMPPMPPGPMMGPMNHMGPPDMSGGPMGGPMGGGGGGGGGWRTGDGKVIVPDVGMNPMQQPMPNMPGGFPPGMDGPMGPPGMMGPPMFNQQEGYGMMGPDDMGYGNFQGPPGPPGMYGPPGPNFPGGPPRGGGPMHGNRGRGSGPGWFRGGGVAGGPMGPRMGGGGWRGGWRGNGKQPPICRQFTKNGFCRVGDKCQYLHPGVNCPPF